MEPIYCEVCIMFLQIAIAIKKRSNNFKTVPIKKYFW